MSAGISKRMKKARALLASGKAETKADAARMAGLSKSAITRDPICQELTAGKSGKRDPMQRALALMAEGMGRIEAAELAGVNPRSILNHLRNKKTGGDK